MGEVLARSWAKVIAWSTKTLVMLCLCVFHLHINREAIAGPRSWAPRSFSLSQKPRRMVVLVGGWIPSNKCKMLLMKPSTKTERKRAEKFVDAGLAHQQPQNQGEEQQQQQQE